MATDGTPSWYVRLGICHPPSLLCLSLLSFVLLTLVLVFSRASLPVFVGFLSCALFPPPLAIACIRSAYVPGATHGSRRGWWDAVAARRRSCAVSGAASTSAFAGSPTYVRRRHISQSVFRSLWLIDTNPSPSSTSPRIRAHVVR